MNEDEAFDSLEELYREGYVDAVPTIGSTDPSKQGFVLTDEGQEHAENLLRENPELVEFICALHLQEHGKDAESLDEFLQWLADEVGINPMEALIEADPDWFDTEDIPEDIVRDYDP